MWLVCEVVLFLLSFVFNVICWQIQLLQLLLVHASGDRTVTPTHHQLEIYMDNSPQETQLEETKAGSPTPAVPVLLSKLPVIKLASTIIMPTNFRRHSWGRFITWFQTGPSVSSTPQPFCVDLPLAPQRSCLGTGSPRPGLAFHEEIHISDGYD